MMLRKIEFFNDKNSLPHRITCLLRVWKSATNESFCNANEKQTLNGITKSSTASRYHSLLSLSPRDFTGSLMWNRPRWINEESRFTSTSRREILGRTSFRNFPSRYRKSIGKLGWNIISSHVKQHGWVVVLWLDHPITEYPISDFNGRLFLMRQDRDIDLFFPAYY